MKYFKLMNDIDLKDLGETTNWVPYTVTVGNALNPTTANTNGAYMNFDGNGYVIKNLRIADPNLSVNYQSFTGFLWGRIQNLGLVNVYINCPKSGTVAAFGAYVGAATPGANDVRVGIIENCFATGYISGGGGAVGGIIGMTGRPSNNGVPSYIKNCYFSGELYNTYTGSSITVRTAGIAAVVYANNTETANTVAPVENCYATGYFHTIKGRVGGVVAENYSTIKNNVAYADLEEEGETANSMGLVVGYCLNSGAAGEFGKVDNCWAFNEAKMKRGGAAVTPSHFTTPGAGTIAPVDGTLKEAAFLSNPLNYYSQLSFSMAGENAVWSQQLRGMYPQFIWVSSRADAESIDGLSNIPSMPTGLSTPQSITPHIIANGNLIIINGIDETYQVSVYDLKGSLLKSFVQKEDGAAIVPGAVNNTVLLVKMTGSSGRTYSCKLIVRK